MEMEDAEGRMIHPDWTVVVSNQLTLITQQATMLDKNQQMVDELKKLTDPNIISSVITQQREIIAAVNNLSVHMDQAREELEVAVGKLSGSVLGIIKVPVVVARLYTRR